MNTSILKSLFDGQLIPTDREYIPNDELNRLHEQRESEMERLLATLSPEEGKRLQGLEDIYIQIVDQLERDAFTFGFCIGTRLLLAALSFNPQGE